MNRRKYFSQKITQSCKIITLSFFKVHKKEDFFFSMHQTWNLWLEKHSMYEFTNSASQADIKWLLQPSLYTRLHVQQDWILDLISYHPFPQDKWYNFLTYTLMQYIFSYFLYKSLQQGNCYRIGFTWTGISFQQLVLHCIIA